MKLSENPNVQKLIDNAFDLGFNQGKEQAEKEFRELIDSIYEDDYEVWKFKEELKNKIGGNGK